MARPAGAIAREKSETIAMLVVLVFLSVIFVVPFVWMAFSSLKRPEDLFIVPMQWLPPHPNGGIT